MKQTKVCATCNRTGVAVLGDKCRRCFDMNVGLVKFVKFEMLNDRATVPTYGSVGAACFDIYSTDAMIVPAGEAAEIGTGIAYEIPEGWRMDILPRSGSARKHRITLTNAVGKIDSDYRGELIVLLTNHGNEPFEVDVGDRIAQGELNPVTRAVFEAVEKLGETARGSDGFGSTGK